MARLDLYAALGADQVRGRMGRVPGLRGRLLPGPAWGENPDLAYDCGKPFGWIKKVGWKAGEDKWPCAYEAIREFKIDNETMGSLIAEIDLEGRELARWCRNGSTPTRRAGKPGPPAPAEWEIRIWTDLPQVFRRAWVTMLSAYAFACDATAGSRPSSMTKTITSNWNPEFGERIILVPRSPDRPKRRRSAAHRSDRLQHGRARRERRHGQ